MKRTFTFISVLALMMSMIALPAFSDASDTAGQCDGYNENTKLDVPGDIAPGGPLVKVTVPVDGTDPVEYIDIWVELDYDEDAKADVVKFWKDADGTIPANMSFCVKGSNTNSGTQTGSEYTVDFDNQGGNLPRISNIVIYFYIPPITIDATLSGAKYEDALPPDGMPIEGWRIYFFEYPITNGLVPFTTDPATVLTGADGSWSATIDDLAPGTQILVCEEQRAGWTQLYPTEGTTVDGYGTCHLVTVTAGQEEYGPYNFVNRDDRGEWCSPGYWRQPQHLDSWAATGYSPEDLYSEAIGPITRNRQGVVNNAPADPTLLDVLTFPQYYGGDAFNAVGDLLSDAHPDVNFGGERFEDTCPLN
jgi:hypothetical protein